MEVGPMMKVAMGDTYGKAHFSAGSWKVASIFLALFLLAGCVEQRPQVTAQAQDYYTNKTVGVVRFTVVDNSPSLNCSLAVNAVQQYAGTVANNTLTAVPVSLVQGDNAVTVRCRDQMLNEGMASLLIHVDSVAPNITYIDFQASP